MLLHTDTDSDIHIYIRYIDIDTDAVKHRYMNCFLFLLASFFLCVCVCLKLVNGCVGFKVMLLVRFSYFLHHHPLFTLLSVSPFLPSISISILQCVERKRKLPKKKFASLSSGLLATPCSSLRKLYFCK